MTDDELFTIGLYRICEQLHMSGNGSADPMFADERAEMVAYLEKRLSNWHSTTPRAFGFDTSMKELVRATLAEELHALRVERT